MTIPTIIENNYLTTVGLKLALRRIQVSVSAATTIGRKPVGLISCLQDAAGYVHRDNKDRGWWTDLHSGEPLQRNVGELLMLMVSEIAEVPERHEALAQADDKLPERLMFEVELADAAIRIFDTAGALAPRFYEGFTAAARTVSDVTSSTLDELDGHLIYIVRQLSLAMECNRKQVMIPWDGDASGHIPGFDYHLGKALHAVFYTGMAYGLNVAEAISDKLEFNRQRADHTVEHRKAAGGKAY